MTSATLSLSYRHDHCRLFAAHKHRRPSFTTSYRRRPLRDTTSTCLTTTPRRRHVPQACATTRHAVLCRCSRHFNTPVCLYRHHHQTRHMPTMSPAEHTRRHYVDIIARRHVTPKRLRPPETSTTELSFTRSYNGFTTIHSIAQPPISPRRCAAPLSTYLRVATETRRLFHIYVNECCALRRPRRRAPPPRHADATDANMPPCCLRPANAETSSPPNMSLTMPPRRHAAKRYAHAESYDDSRAAMNYFLRQRRRLSATFEDDAVPSRTITHTLHYGEFNIMNTTKASKLISSSVSETIPWLFNTIITHHHAARSFPGPHACSSSTPIILVNNNCFEQYAHNTHVHARRNNIDCLSYFNNAVLSHVISLTTPITSSLSFHAPPPTPPITKERRHERPPYAYVCCPRRPLC